MRNVKKAKTPLNEAVVKGSKIPITFLFDYIKAGYTISDFLSAYPWIKKEEVVKKLEKLKDEKVSSKYVL